MTGSEVEFNLAQGLTIESPMERHRTTLRNERSGSILNRSSHSGDLPLRRGVGPALVPPALYATSTSIPGVDTIAKVSWKASGLLLSPRPTTAHHRLRWPVRKSPVWHAAVGPYVGYESVRPDLQVYGDYLRGLRPRIG